MKVNPILLDAASYRFSYDMPTRFSDIDLQNHLNNTRIGEFYQEGRVRFFNGLVDAKKMQRPDWLRVLVANIDINYLAEVNYPQIVSMKLAIAKLGRTSITLQMAMFSEGHCAGLAKVVIVIGNEQGTAPIPDDWRAALTDYLLPAEALKNS